MLSEWCGWEREKQRIPVWSAVWWWTRLQRRSRRQPTAPWFTMQPRRFLSLLLFLASPFSSSPVLFNSAHPIIRNLSGRHHVFFLLPGTAVGVGRIASGAHWLSCCYVLRVSERRGGALALWLLYRNVWHSAGSQVEESPGEGFRWPPISLWGDQTHSGAQIMSSSSALETK